MAIFNSYVSLPEGILYGYILYITYMIHIVIWYFLNIATLQIFLFCVGKNIDTSPADPMGQLKTAIQLGRELFFHGRYEIG